MTVATLEAVGTGQMQLEVPTTNIDARTSFFATGHFVGTPQTNRSMLLFDISEIPSDAVVSAVDLKITVQNNFLGTSHTLNIYRLKRKWYKGTATPPLFPDNEGSWNNYRQDLTQAWSTAGAGDTTNDRDASTIGTHSITAATSGTQTIALTPSLVQEWTDGTIVNNGIILQASVESGSDTLMRWLTLDDATPSNRPQLVVTYTAASEALNLLDDIAFYFKADDDYVDAVAGNNLTPTNSPTFVAGRINNAFHFVAASSQYASSNAAALKRPVTDWTMAGWLKLTDKSEFYSIVSQSDTPNPTGGAGFRFFYHKQTVLDYFTAQLNSDSGVAEVADVIAYNGGNPATGTLIFFAVRHDSVRKRLDVFIDDNDPNSAPDFTSGEQWGFYTGTPIQATGPFYIGRYAEGEYHNGDVDEVGGWNRWLSRAEIDTLRNGGAGNQYPFGIVADGNPYYAYAQQ